MDKPNNREADDREPRTEDDKSGSSKSIDGDYYYDDSTGYEVYKSDDDESADDERDGPEED